MKIRNGFVSNSSSSSFCVYGQTFDINDIANIIGVAENDDDEYYELCENIENKLYKLSKDSELEVFVGYESECALIGLPYSKLKDDETGAQFKERAEVSIGNVLGVKPKCNFINEEFHS